jgi:hypothetical protein
MVVSRLGQSLVMAIQVDTLYSHTLVIRFSWLSFAVSDLMAMVFIRSGVVAAYC